MNALSARRASRRASLPIRGAAAVAALGLTALATTAAHAQMTIGNALVARANYDSATGSLFVMTDTGFTTPGTVTTWGFYDNTQPTSSVITPVIFQLVGGNYNVTGVGTTRTNTAGGVQSYSFGLTSGSATVGANYFFGWRDGNSSGTTTNAGVPTFDGSGTGTVRWFGNANPTVGSTPGTQGDFARTYSLQATTSASAPEPTALLLLAPGALGMVGMIARHRRD